MKQTDRESYKNYVAILTLREILDEIRHNQQLINTMLLGALKPKFIKYSKIYNQRIAILLNELSKRD